MTHFHDEAASRLARLLRMARTDDPVTRERIVRHAEATPEPPPMGPHGLATRGCPRCRRTMWAQRDRDDHVWVCGGCGHVEGTTVDCPHCGTRMKNHPDCDRAYCGTCPRWAATGDTAADIEAHEQQRLEAIRLLDLAMADRGISR